MRILLSRGTIVVCALVAVACGSTSSAVNDAAVDGTTTDGGVTETDAAMVDAAMVDAPADAAVDAMVDAAADAMVDAAPCGNGAPDTGEQCDQGASNGTLGSCCTASCTFAAVTVECRAAATACDVAERCTGADGACPANLLVADGEACVGNGTNACSAADTCADGVCGDNDAAALTACSDEPTCNPDVCTATGTCTDAAAVVDNTACSERGGSACCGARCSVISQGGSCATCALRAHGPQRITIIESQSSNAGHNMDSQWSAIAAPLGHTATIVPQTTLDDLANLATTDILVVASGLIDLPPARRATIEAFAASHRGVYLQAEYQTSYATNQTLAQIINNRGGTFTWTGTVVGQQDPVTVIGCLANTAEVSTSLTAYWYACTGTGTGAGLRTIHTAPGGQPVGWSYCLPGGGLVISNTDQDFIRTPAAGTAAHMRNVLLALADAANCT